MHIRSLLSRQACLATSARATTGAIRIELHGPAEFVGAVIAECVASRLVCDYHIDRCVQLDNESLR
jgi:hypothetical protein